MAMNYITINGTQSSTYGLYCKQLPMFPVAVQSFNTFAVGGRLENIYQQAAFYNDILVDIDCVLIGFDMDPVIRWLQTGKTLSFSHITDKYLVIRQLVAVEQTRVGNGALEIKITFKCSPFKYSTAGAAEYTASPSYFKTNGTIYSEPLITAKGCSDGFSMALNGATFATSGLTGDIYIDVPNRVTYQLVSNVRTVVDDHTTGNIWDLLLVPSSVDLNELTFTGATSIQIQKNERWL